MYGLNRLCNLNITYFKWFPYTLNIRHVGLGAKRSETVHEDNFIPIYKFPYIRPFSVINRLKIYQTIITAACIPGSLALNQMDYIDINSLYTLCTIGTSGCLSLYGLGLLTTKFIGFIYYNEKKNLVKISFVDFWGNRKDILVPTNDIIPIDESPSSPLDGLFLTLRRYSTKETLRLNLKLGIIDEENMKKVL